MNVLTNLLPMAKPYSVNPHKLRTLALQASGCATVTRYRGHNQWRRYRPHAIHQSAIFSPPTAAPPGSASRALRHS